MLIADFLTNIENNCSEISSLCVKHIIDKLYKNIDEADELELKQNFSDYNIYNKYLNDYAGTIYNKYSSNIDKVYIDICNFLKIDIDNQYTVEHIITKLERQEPSSLLKIEDDDIKIQAVENFEDKLNAVLSSNYYNKNKEQFNERVEKISKNLMLIKNVLQIKD